MKGAFMFEKLIPHLCRSIVSGAVIGLMSGCATGYEAGTVSLGSIQNPSIGWHGYSVKVPESYTVFDPSQMDPSDTSNKAANRRAILADEKQYTANLAVAYHERFLLEGDDDQSYITFISDTYEFSSPLSTFTGVEKDYFLRSHLNAKLVKMNDTDAFQELITLNGHRAFHIRGDWRPYFNEEAEPIVYEGYFVLGELKEAYWIEGFATKKGMATMRKAVWEMVESLKIQK